MVRGRRGRLGDRGIVSGEWWRGEGVVESRMRTEVRIYPARGWTRCSKDKLVLDSMRAYSSEWSWRGGSG